MFFFRFTVYFLITSIVFISCRKKVDPSFLEKIEKEGQKAYLKNSFSESVYSDPDTNSKVIGELFFDSEIKGIEVENKEKQSWFQFAMNTDIGWIPSEKLQKKENPYNGHLYIVIEDTVNVYGSQDEKSAPVGQLKFGAEGKYFSLSRNNLEWLPIQYNGRKAFLKNAENSFTDIYRINYRFVISDGTDVKEFPSDTAKKIGKINYDKMIQCLKNAVSESESRIKYIERERFSDKIPDDVWCLINNEGKKGYVKGKDLAAGNRESYIVIADSLKIREKPDLSSKTLGTLQKDDSVYSLDKSDSEITVDGITDHWVSMEYNGKKAWVFRGFLMSEERRKNKESEEAYRKGLEECLKSPGCEY